MKLIATLMLAFSIDAHAWLREGPFNLRGLTYFSNGVGAYCQKSIYDYTAPMLTPWEERELYRLQFHGLCDDGYALGPFNFRGRSFYASRGGAFCEFRYYDYRLREISDHEAQIVFRGRYNGYCQ